MILSPSDQAKLARILHQARELEMSWPAVDRLESRELGGHPLYEKLKAEIAGCAAGDAEVLRRLAGTVIHFHDRVSLRHFYSLLVPFERLTGRALRDDEFLVVEGDGSSPALSKVPLKIIAENIRSAFNIGALFRTSECLGVSEIVLCGYSPGPDEVKTLRTAMGTDELVAWRRLERARTACEDLRREGYLIVALETAATAVSLHEFEFGEKPVAFVLGNERFGIEADTLAAVDFICRIPTRGIKNSMNVGVAFGIAAFEWLRQYEGHSR